MGRGVTFPATDARSINQIRLIDFLGVDYSDAATNLSRARNMNNMLRENEILSMRRPIKYESSTSFEAKINGIYEWHVQKDNQDMIVIHSGTNIIIMRNGETEMLVKYDNVISDKESMATVLDNKLVIFDGTEPYLLYQDSENEFGINHCKLYDYEELYAPTTSIARSPDGTSNTWFQAPNRINNYRQNWFQTTGKKDATTVSLTLDDTIYKDDNERFKVEQMNYKGEWIDRTESATIKTDNSIDLKLELVCDPIYNDETLDVDNLIYISLERLSRLEDKNGTNIPFTIDKENYKVVFDSPKNTSTFNATEAKYYFTLNGDVTLYDIINADNDIQEGTTTINGVYFNDIGVTPIRGNDNIKVTFSVDMREYRKEIDTCNIVTKYGYQANMNRIFVAGNTYNDNVVLWSEANNPLYWPEDHWAKVGESAVLGFSHTRDGSLLIHKKKQTDNITTYYMGSELAVLIDKYERTVETFPIISAVGDFELVNRYMTDTYLNDPCFLTSNGIYSVSATSGASDTNDERFSNEKSYYIRQRIPDFIANNPKGLIQFGKFLFMFNDRQFYVADKTHVSYSPERVEQYEWYPCDSLLFNQERNPHFINSVNVCWNTLYIGDDTGILYKYDVNSNDFYDGDYRYTTDSTIYAIVSEWESQFISADIVDYNKTLTNIFVNYSPFAYHNRFDVFVTTSDVDKNVYQEWYNIEDNLSNPYVEDFAEYNQNTRSWYGDMAYRYNYNKTFKIRQRTNNFTECSIKLSNKSYENISLSKEIPTYTTHVSLRSIVLDVALGRRVR